jgi:hypothetical protein
VSIASWREEEGQLPRGKISIEEKQAATNQWEGCDHRGRGAVSRQAGIEEHGQGKKKTEKEKKNNGPCTTASKKKKKLFTDDGSGREERKRRGTSRQNFWSAPLSAEYVMWISAASERSGSESVLNTVTLACLRSSSTKRIDEKHSDRSFARDILIASRHESPLLVPNT